MASYDFNRYSIFPSRIGDLVFRDLTDFSFRTASNKSVVIPGGDLHPRAIVNCCSDPMATFSTKDFDAMFSSSQVTLQGGYAANTAGGTAASLFQFQARVDGATFSGAGNATHTVGSNNKGFLNITDITAQQDDTEGAKISCEFTILSDDGMLEPITWNTATTLTSTPNFDGIWFLGPVRIGAHGSSTVQLPGIQSVSIKSGVVYRAPRADGCIYPHNGSVYSIVPEIRIRTLDFSQLGIKLAAGGISTFGNAFLNPTTTFLIYFQKGVHGGGRVAAATTQHYMVQATTGDNTMDSISVQQIDDATTEVIIRPTGGITMSVGVAIN